MIQVLDLNALLKMIGFLPPKKMVHWNCVWVVVSTPLKNIIVSWDDYSRYIYMYVYICKNKTCSKPPTRMVLWSCLKKNRSTRKKQRNPINPATFHHWHINSAGTVPASPWPCPSRGRACETARKPSSALGPGAHGRSPARKVSTEFRLWANLGQGPAIFWTPPHGIWWCICGRKQEVIKMDDVRGIIWHLIWHTSSKNGFMCQCMSYKPPTKNCSCAWLESSAIQRAPPPVVSGRMSKPTRYLG